MVTHRIGQNLYAAFLLLIVDFLYLLPDAVGFNLEHLQGIAGKNIGKGIENRDRVFLRNN